MNQKASQSFEARPPMRPVDLDAASCRSWYAVLTVPRHEKSVVKHLDLREIESFLPTYESVRVWKNRQRAKVTLPLFPSYLFVNINSRDRAKILGAPGVLQIVGNGREYVPVRESEIDFLRSGLCGQPVDPYHELVVGELVRVKRGVMRGLCGTLVRKGRDARFVLTLELINQHAAVQVDPNDLEPLVA